MKTFKLGDMIRINGNNLLCFILNPRFTVMNVVGVQVYCLEHRQIYYLLLSDCHKLYENI